MEERALHFEVNLFHKKILKSNQKQHKNKQYEIKYLKNLIL